MSDFLPRFFGGALSSSFACKPHWSASSASETSKFAVLFRFGGILTQQFDA